MNLKKILLAVAFIIILVSFTSCASHKHTEEILPAVAPTCTETGLTEGKRCTECGEITLPRETIDKLPHTEIVLPAVAPTCTKSGVTEGKYCSVCNLTIKEQRTVEATGHLEVTVPAVAPTCEKGGYTESKHCSVCNEVLVKQIQLPATEHTEVIDKAVPASSFATGLTEGSHCSGCNKVLKEQKVTDKVPPVSVSFPSGYITTEETVIETEYFIFTVPANVYIPQSFTEYVDYLASVMEEVSGMKFSGKPIYASPALVDVEKPAETQSEYGSAYASMFEIVISSGDITNMYTFIHESSHFLQYKQSGWAYCQWAMEGISTYTTYKVQQYIMEHNPEMMTLISPPNQSLWDYYMSKDGYNELYSRSMEYWMENILSNSGNANYVIGFRLMRYLDETYGSYTDWILEYEKINPQNYEGGVAAELSIQNQIKAFKSTYGDSVFDDFYAWLKENEGLFYEYGPIIDLSDVEKIQLFPECTYYGILYRMPTFKHGIKYNNLFIDIQEGKNYLTEYKDKNTDNMYLTVSAGTVVELYDGEGRLIRTEESVYDEETEKTNRISLSGVSFIKLVGEGTITEFSIKGFENYGSLIVDGIL